MIKFICKKEQKMSNLITTCSNISEKLTKFSEKR
nr:MAG TPA: hypothetical protein [Caudoviricetes sp.]